MMVTLFTVMKACLMEGFFSPTFENIQQSVLLDCQQILL